MRIKVKLLASDHPGMTKRYATYEVDKSPEVPICVTVDGECNHADTDMEDVSMSYDPSETERAEVCNGCGAIYNKYDCEWMR